MKKSFLPKVVAGAALICSSVAAQAQMTDCDVFLKGSHLEIGIGSDGAFGSSIQAPTGYHVNVTDTLYDDCTSMSYQLSQELGFVADPNLTNWTSYYGDFVMPDNPREGWAIEDSAGSANSYSYNYYTGTSGFSGAITGANTAYTATGGTLQASWSGIYNSYLNVNQVVTIDTANLYLLVHVGFYNTGTAPNTFYYVRTINPHNNAVTTANLNTKARIEHQLPNPDGLVVVSARGITDTMAYIAMGTRDPRAKAFIAKDSTLPHSSLAALWTGDTSLYNYTDTLTGNHAMGLAYKITLGPGDSSFLDYGYSFQGGIIDTVLDTSLHSTTGTDSTTLKIKTVTSNHINVYPNPATGFVNISGLATGNNVTLYDVTGRAVLNNKAATGQSVQSVNIAALNPGIYLVIVRDANGNTLAKVPLNKQ